MMKECSIRLKVCQKKISLMQNTCLVQNILQNETDEYKFLKITWDHKMDRLNVHLRRSIFQRKLPGRT